MCPNYETGKYRMQNYNCMLPQTRGRVYMWVLSKDVLARSSFTMPKYLQRLPLPKLQTFLNPKIENPSPYLYTHKQQANICAYKKKVVLNLKLNSPMPYPTPCSLTISINLTSTLNLLSNGADHLHLDCQPLQAAHWSKHDIPL